MTTYFERLWVYIKIIPFVCCEKYKKVLLTQKYVTFYSYVNMCFKSLSKIMSFSSPLRIIYEFFKQ